MLAQQAALTLQTLVVFTDLGSALLHALAARVEREALTNSATLTQDLRDAAAASSGATADVAELAAALHSLGSLGPDERATATKLLSTFTMYAERRRHNREARLRLAVRPHSPAASHRRPARAGNTGLGVGRKHRRRRQGRNHRQRYRRRPSRGERCRRRCRHRVRPQLPHRHPPARGTHEDVYGHGTACAAIIHSLAPDAEVYSIRVLGPRLTGKAFIFAAGLGWAIEHGMDVVNLSLSTSNRAHFATFHRLVDDAVFRKVMVVSAMTNWPGRSYPSEFSGVFSVAAHDGTDPKAFDFNPQPPAEWGAPESISRSPG